MYDMSWPNLWKSSITQPEPVFLYMLSDSVVFGNDSVVLVINDSISAQIFVTFVALFLERFTLLSIVNGEFGLTIRAIKL